MTTNIETHNPAPHGRFSWVKALQVFAVVWACLCVWQDVDNLARNARLELDLGTKGLQLAYSSKVPGYVAIASVQPGGPADRAGIVAGDLIHYDNYIDFTRHPFVGEHIGGTLDHGGQRRHIVLSTDPLYQAQPLDWSFLTEDLGNAAATLIMALFAGVIALRSRGKLTTILLALGLMTYGLSTYIPERSFSGRGIYVAALIAGVINLGSIPFLFHAFALNFYRDTVVKPKPWEYGLLAGYGVIQGLLTATMVLYSLTAISLPVVADGFGAMTLISLFGFGAAFVYIFLGWRRSLRDVQQRYAILLLATSAVILAQAITQVSNAFLITGQLQTILYILQSVLGGVVAPPLFAYAILRHKVLDLGFALNRTLVYTVISFVVLLVFGLAEWGIEKVLPHDWREHVEANAFISAGIALCIFLVFHRIRDFVEHYIEKLFFRRWHQKEADLKRFVHEAAYILKRDPMVVAYVAAVRDFCGGGDAPPYLADDDGAYRRVEGSLPGQSETLDGDNPFLVTLRADRKVFEPGQLVNPVLTPIAVVLPMIHRTEVIGATLLGAKPNGFSYRPDEKDVLAWAAHQIGLDLHALEVERLQQANTALVASNDVLSAKYDLLGTKYDDLRGMTEGLLREGR